MEDRSRLDKRIGHPDSLVVETEDEALAEQLKRFMLIRLPHTNSKTY